MNRYISGIITAISLIAVTGSLCIGIAGCGKKEQDLTPPQTKTSIIPEDGDMLIISTEIVGPINWEEEDRVTGVSYTIEWNGTITRTSHHMDSGDEETGKADISKSDLMALYEFAEDAYRNDKYKDYSEDVCDGETYSFVYYPAGKGTAVHLYYGYCYSNKDLWNAVTIAKSYFKAVDATPTPVPQMEELRARSGVMVMLYDEQNKISYIVRWNGEISSNAHEKNSDHKWDYISLSDEDYMTLYNFAQKAYENASYEDYFEAGKGDNRWQLKYFPPDSGNEYRIYSGLIDNSGELSAIAEMVCSYF